jgi:hypothetical protein
MVLLLQSFYFSAIKLARFSAKWLMNQWEIWEKTNTFTISNQQHESDNCVQILVHIPPHSHFMVFFQTVASIVVLDTQIMIHRVSVLSVVLDGACFHYECEVQNIDNPCGSTNFMVPPLEMQDCKQHNWFHPRCKFLVSMDWAYHHFGVQIWNGYPRSHCPHLVLLVFYKVAQLLLISLLQML